MRLLLVEDDAALATVLIRGLREEGYAVDHETTVAGGDLAVAVTDYDVAVLDLGLPDGDGLQVCRALRERDAPTRVLLLTARASVADRIDGLDAGADDYLGKPFDFGELSARLRALLRRPSGVTPPRLGVADLTLDPAAHEVRRGGVLLPLTAREFALLHVLLRRADQVVTRTDLLEHVWDAHYEGGSNVVDVHVASLRRKLGPPPLLETVRGVGYRLRDTAGRPE